MKQLLAYTNCEQGKDDAVKAAKWHREQDMLIAGTYFEGDKESFTGCSVGCMYAPYNGYKGKNLHYLSESVHGIPEWLTRVRDTFFEKLSSDKRNDWHVDFMEAPRKGAPLDTIKPAFMVFILKSNLDNFDHDKFPDVKAAVDGSIALWQRNDIGSDEWESAQSAVESVAESAGWSVAWSASYDKFVNELLRLMRECEPVTS